MNNDFCANCAAWQPPPLGATNPMGQCRLHPPKAFMVMVGPPQLSKDEERIVSLAGAKRGPQPGPQPMFLSAWPPAPSDGWCAEHLRIDAAPKQ